MVEVSRRPIHLSHNRRGREYSTFLASRFRYTGVRSALCASRLHLAAQLLVGRYFGGGAGKRNSCNSCIQHSLVGASSAGSRGELGGMRHAHRVKYGNHRMDGGQVLRHVAHVGGTSACTARRKLNQVSASGTKGSVAVSEDLLLLQHRTVGLAGLIPQHLSAAHQRRATACTQHIVFTLLLRCGIVGANLDLQVGLRVEQVGRSPVRQ